MFHYLFYSDLASKFQSLGLYFLINVEYQGFSNLIKCTKKLSFLFFVKISATINHSQTILYSSVKLIQLPSLFLDLDTYFPPLCNFFILSFL